MKSSEAGGGRAAELRLQGLRNNLHRRQPLAAGEHAKDGEPCNPEDLEAMLWVAGLAESGHWGARRILRRIADETAMVESLARFDPESAMKLTAASRDAARRAALTEVHGPAPDWPRAIAWLERAGDPLLAHGLRDAQRLCGTFTEGDLGAIRATLAERRSGGDLLADLGQLRIGSNEAQALALLETAAAQGSRRALRGMLQAAWLTAPDRAKLAEAWCARYEAHVPAAEVRAVLRIAQPLSPAEMDLVKLALESGVGESGALLREVAKVRHKAGADPELIAALLEAEMAVAGRGEFQALWKYLWKGAGDKRATLDWWFDRFSDFDLQPQQLFRVGVWVEKGARDPEVGRSVAALWYARSRGESMAQGDPVTASLCYFIGVHLDPNVSFCWAKEPERARAWLERGLDMGEARCLDDWLRSCALGRLGLTPDPVAALERVRRFAAVAKKSGDPLEGYTIGLASTVANADALVSGKKTAPDPQAARLWLQVGAELGYKPALDRLAALDGAAQR